MKSSDQTKSDWHAQHERGGVMALRLIGAIALALGRPLTVTLMWPISLYYLAASASARRNSKAYLARVLTRHPSSLDSWRHFHTFAVSLLDRLYIAAGRMQSLRIDIEGEGVLRAAMSAGEGCVLVGSHLGNFDAVRICGLRVGVPLKILMHTEQSPIMMSVLYGRHPAWLASLIPLGRADSFLQAHAALMAGDYVALLSDRAYREERSVLLPFLGAPALFPAGPMQLAAISGKPVVMFFGIYTGKGCYKVRFESLAGANEFAACERDVIVSAMLTRYVARLEVQCRRSPFNWFNFFDFWRDAIRAHD